MSDGYRGRPCWCGMSVEALEARDRAHYVLGVEHGRNQRDGYAHGYNDGERAERDRVAAEIQAMPRTGDWLPGVLAIVRGRGEAGT